MIISSRLPLRLGILSVFFVFIIMQTHGHIEAASPGRTVTEHASPRRTATEHASTSASTHNTPPAADMSVICVGDQKTLNRPCVDCGQVTGRFCDLCHAAQRCPNEHWAPNQMTPLCETCEETLHKCHFCRGQSWCVPPTWQRSSPSSG